MANACFGWPDHLNPDPAFATVALSGGNWTATLPRANMITPLLSEVARTSGVTLLDTTWTVDLGTARAVRLMAIVGHNFSINAKWRVLGSNTFGTFASPTFDTDWQDIFPVVYPLGSVPWEHPSFWNGKLDAESASRYNVPAIYILSSASVTRYLRFDIDDTTNDDGYIQVGRLFVSSVWQPTLNLRPGATLGWDSASRVREGLSGVRFYDARNSRRVLRAGISDLPLDEALAQPFELEQVHGIHKQFFFVWDPDDLTHRHRRSFLCTLRELTPVEFPYFGVGAKPIDIIEVI
jgi:hypothetical protein